MADASNSNKNQNESLYRRPAPKVPDGERVRVDDCFNVLERFEQLGLDVPESVAVLPRNFDIASTAEELVMESAAPDIRIVGRQVGVEVDTFGGVGAKQIHENDALAVGAIIWFTLETFNHGAGIVELLERVANRVARRSGKSDSDHVEIEQQVVITDKKTKISKSFAYRGPASQVAAIVPVMQETMNTDVALKPVPDSPNTAAES
jgi:hypothetical protein